ncbi:MAG: peptidoglycan DD-metalloendopeptidase family protein [bacterium]|nr:peptidoglycan DD-metalloendopeptidase family protein [bacterium]
MGKRKKILSILFIPEGEKQTFTIKISYLTLKVLFTFSVIFFLILSIGAVSYWQIAKIALDYERVERLNQKLLNDNLIINDLVERFNVIQDNDRRIRSLFGEMIDFSDTDEILEFNRYSDETAQYSSLLGGTASRFINSKFQVDLLSSFPSLEPVKGQITRDFSDSGPEIGNSHFGIDIAAKELSVIRAAGDGIVIFANWTHDAGNLVVIDHLNGYISIYKHNSSLSVMERQYVSQGDPIALLGNSGISTAPHLHFEIWKDYKPINPLDIVNQ